MYEAVYPCLGELLFFCIHHRSGQLSYRTL